MTNIKSLLLRLHHFQKKKKKKQDTKNEASTLLLYSRSAEINIFHSFSFYIFKFWFIKSRHIQLRMQRHLGHKHKSIFSRAIQLWLRTRNQHWKKKKRNPRHVVPFGRFIKHAANDEINSVRKEEERVKPVWLWRPEGVCEKVNDMQYHYAINIFK